MGGIEVLRVFVFFSGRRDISKGMKVERKGNSGWRRVVWMKESKYGLIFCGDKDVFWEGWLK